MWCRTIFGFLIVWFVPIFVAGSRETAEEEYYYVLIDDFEQPVQWTGSVVAQGRTNTLIIQRIENTVEARKRIEKYATMFARDLSPASRAVSPRQNYVLGIKDIITSPGERILRIRPRQPVRIENVLSLNFYLQKDKHDFVLYPVILDVDKSRLPTEDIAGIMVGAGCDSAIYDGRPGLAFEIGLHPGYRTPSCISGLTSW